MVDGQNSAPDLAPHYNLGLPPNTVVRTFETRDGKPFEGYVHSCDNELEDPELWTEVFRNDRRRRVAMAVRYASSGDDLDLFWSVECDSPEVLHNPGDDLPAQVTVMSTCSHDNEGWHRIINVVGNDHARELADTAAQFLARNILDDSTHLITTILQTDSAGRLVDRETITDDTLGALRAYKS